MEKEKRKESETKEGFYIRLTANKQYLFMNEKRNRSFYSSVLFFTHRKNEQLQGRTFTPIPGLRPYLERESFVETFEKSGGIFSRRV